MRPKFFRMAIQDIPKGQWESAQSIGMTPIQTLTRIILPQMWMVALPGLGNLTLVLLKDTALVSLIGLQDLMYFAQRAAQSTKTFYILFSCCFYLFGFDFGDYTFFIMWCESRANPAARYAKLLHKRSGVNHELELASNY